MYTSIKIYEAGPAPASIVVNELTPPLNYPVEVFNWTDPTRGDPIPKMQAAGRHDRYSDIDSMLINMQGHIMGDTTTEYWTMRKALLAIVIPKPGHLFRYHGTIEIQLDGDAETYWCNVTLEDRDTPTEALYPTVTPFQFQWTNEFGYWRKLSNNAVAYI